MLRVVTHCLSRGRIIRFVGLLSAATLCGAAAVAQVTLSSQHHVLGVHRAHRAAQAPPASTTTTTTTFAPAIPYNGGAVFPNATTYAIWWGKPADFPPDAREGVNDFLEGLDGTAYIDIADEYLFGQQARTRFGGNYFDTSPPTTVDGSTSSIVAEVYKVLTANGVKPVASSETSPGASLRSRPRVRTTEAWSAASTILAQLPDTTRRQRIRSIESRVGHGSSDGDEHEYSDNERRRQCSLPSTCTWRERCERCGTM
jgi:hypothetical protein